MQDIRKSLNERELAILDRMVYVDLPESLAAIGSSFEIARQNISQIKKGLLKKLRAALAEGVFRKRRLHMTKNLSRLIELKGELQARGKLDEFRSMLRPMEADMLEVQLS